MHLIGVYLIGVHLIGVHLISVHLIGVYLTGYASYRRVLYFFFSFPALCGAERRKYVFLVS
jgi:hypothetical protein